MIGPSADLKLTAYRIGGEPSPPAGALRIAAVRLPPRGVPRSKFPQLFDVRFPLLSPSRELLSWWRSKPPSEPRFREFTRRYHKEMAREEPRQAIELLAATARRMPVALGCYCETEQCHRFLLEKLIRQV
jgi:uncharacterized protein YeaO (DUF488 family)